MQKPIFYNKTKRKGLLSAILGGLMTVSGIVLLILPLAVSSGIEDFTKNIVFLSVGGVSLVIGFCLLVSGMTQWLVRPYAIVFTEDGLYDFTGKNKNGLFIEWSNVKDAKVCGKDDSAYIGIDIVNLELAYKNINKKQKKSIDENISNNMPAIMIRQAEVKEPIGSIIKALLQIHLGTNADLFNESETYMLDSASITEPVEETTKVEESFEQELSTDSETPKKDLFIHTDFEKTGPIDLPDDDKDELFISEFKSDESEDEKASEVPPLPDSNRVETSENTAPKNNPQKKSEDYSKATSIDDLLAMLSIGDEK